MKLSIIITAYNEEKYIGRCLRALSEQQTRFKYEVIVVNDGSTDNTQRVLTQYVKKFRDIFKPYCKENSGQGLSRNFGIKQSIGEYIGFVDADDWVNQNFVELMCESAQKHNSDIVVCDVHKIYVARMLEEDVTSLEGKKEVVDIANYIRNGQSNSYSCNKIYRRDIWQRYNFKKMVYEDLDVIIPILSHCRMITYVPVALYNYYKHAGTTTTSYKDPHLFDIYTAYKDILTDVNERFLREAEFCVAKRIMINIDTIEFGYHLGYFIQLIQQLSNHFKLKQFIDQDDYVSSIYCFMSVDLLKNHIFVDGKVTFDSMDAYRFDETVIDMNGKTFANSDLELGGIILSKNIKIQSPVGYLRTLGNFVIFGNDNKIVAVGLKQRSLIVQRMFLTKHKLAVDEILEKINLLIKGEENFMFDVGVYNVSDLKHKLSVKEVTNESSNI